MCALNTVPVTGYLPPVPFIPSLLFCSPLHEPSGSDSYGLRRGWIHTGVHWAWRGLTFGSFFNLTFHAVVGTFQTTSVAHCTVPVVLYATFLALAHL